MDLSRNLVKMAKIKNHNNFDLKKKKLLYQHPNSSIVPTIGIIFSLSVFPPVFR